ncbi:MAG: hypothetical protein A2042_02725 [Candidatus Schekmanbacteria bacterium GWA2_38_11]|uniref:Uncharacterized protein n=1 Tax=Candidatus Schekmanbacteria bacterium GWA2_38_11 TaxID=1817876 RepID=A0A1F7RGT0_9BACT|nr:MAG: hypothetical protein A2042_02725 [Candidatus Schekmanbacteria bacterium GWA2_38_11]
MGLFGRKKIYIKREDFPVVINNIARSLEALREEYIFGSLSQLKREGVDVSNISRDISPGSQLEDALKGFQLTSMMGITWDYIRSIEDKLAFDLALSKHMNAEKESRAWDYRERYIDCQGDMDALAKTLSFDVYKSIGSPIPRDEFLIQFQGGAYVLIGLCQAATYSACGDSKMERKIRGTMRFT